MLIVDSHLDLSWNAVNWKRDLTANIDQIRKSEEGMTGVGRGTNTVSFPELRKAEVGLCLGTLLAREVVNQNPPFIPYATPELAYIAVQAQVSYYTAMCEEGALRQIHDRVALDDHLREWEEETERCPLGFILSMEGADSILAPSQLPEWWEQGLRIIGPAHYGQNIYTHGTSTVGGLKPQGFALLREMEKLGILLDVTHLADQALEEALDTYAGPVLASHHNCRSLVPGQRQLPDEHIRRLAERNAVIGVVFDAWMLDPAWVRGESTPDSVLMTSVIDHIDHICQLTGSSRHVGIGSDLDGGFGTEQSPGDLNTIADLQKLIAPLSERGYSTPDIEGIFHRNWIEFFRRSWS